MHARQARKELVTHATPASGYAWVSGILDLEQQHLGLGSRAMRATTWAHCYLGARAMGAARPGLGMALGALGI